MANSVTIYPSPGLMESIKIIHQQKQKADNASITQTQVVCDLIEDALLYRDILDVLKSNKELKLVLDAEVKRKTEKSKPVMYA